jgi:TRAP-type C4-dicarboxylate transport system permease small subunit
MYALPMLVKSRPDASVLTSAIIFLYCCYLQWSSFISNTNAQCNTIPIPSSTSFEVILSGLGFTIVSLVIVAATNQTDSKNNVATSLNDHLKEDENEDEKPSDVEEHNNKKLNAEDTHTFSITPATIMFQNLLMWASIYYACLLTNWGNVSLFNGDNSTFFTESNTAYWLKFISLWVTMVLYIFSLLAPLCFPDRDFN